MRILILTAVIGFFSNPAFVLAQQVSVATRTQFKPAQTQAVREWLASRAIPLKSVQAGAGFDDLKPLKSVLKNVSVVGLGEASHGQREFFQFRHRMLEFLVIQMGFTAFSLEASYPGCMNINEYVVHGKGDPRKAIAGQGLSIYNTEEILNMVEWMRQYNSKQPEAKRARFLGYDMQMGYQYAMDALAAYLKKLSPGKLTEAETAFVPLKAERGKPLAITVQSPEEQAKSLTRLNELHSFLVTNRGKFIGQTSEWDFNVVLLHTRVLTQGAKFSIAMAEGLKKAQANKDMKERSLYSWLGEGIELRDHYMAENIEAQLKMLGPKARMVVAGHNGHVMAGSWDSLPDTKGLKIPTMGGNLRKIFGDAYYALGFDFDHGSFQASGTDEKGARGMQEFPIPPALEGSLAWYMRTATQPAQTPPAPINNLRFALVEGQIK